MVVLFCDEIKRNIGPRVVELASLAGVNANKRNSNLRLDTHVHHFPIRGYYSIAYKIKARFLR